MTTDAHLLEELGRAWAEQDSLLGEIREMGREMGIDMVPSSYVTRYWRAVGRADALAGIAAQLQAEQHEAAPGNWEGDPLFTLNGFDMSRLRNAIRDSFRKENNQHVRKELLDLRNRLESTFGMGRVTVAIDETQV